GRATVLPREGLVLASGRTVARPGPIIPKVAVNHDPTGPMQLDREHLARRVGAMNGGQRTAVFHLLDGYSRRRLAPINGVNEHRLSAAMDDQLALAHADQQIVRLPTCPQICLIYRGEPI